MSRKGTLRVNSMAECTALKNRAATAYPPFPASSKFHAVQTEISGIKFSTKKEARFYQELQARKHIGEIKFILRQVPFDLPGHYDNGKIIRHFVDFAICRNDDTFQFIEVKGRDLPMGKLKRRQVEELYKIHIVVV